MAQADLSHWNRYPKEINFFACLCHFDIFASSPYFLSRPSPTLLCVADVQCSGSDINMRQPSRPLSPCGNWKAISKPLFRWRGGTEKEMLGEVGRSRKAIGS